MRAKALTLSLIYLLLLGPVLPAKEKKSTNPWQKLFTEPIETVYIIMKDETIFKHTSHDEGKIYMIIDRLERALKTPEKSYKIKDIAIVIHNHLKDCDFSSDDWKQYRDLKNQGFDGLYLIYCHMTNKTYDIEDGKKST